jgi:hypothetical protein
VQLCRPAFKVISPFSLPTKQLRFRNLGSGQAQPSPCTTLPHPIFLIDHPWIIGLDGSTCPLSYVHLFLLLPCASQPLVPWTTHLTSPATNGNLTACPCADPPSPTKSIPLVLPYLPPVTSTIHLSCNRPPFLPQCVYKPSQKCHEGQCNCSLTLLPCILIFSLPIFQP